MNTQNTAHTGSISLPMPMDRNIHFSDQVTQSSIREVLEKILQINQNDEHLKKVYSLYDLEYKPKPINIYIDSYGGAVYQCFGLLAVMDASKTPIHTYVTGAAMSCGFLMLIHGHKRFAFKHSTPLYHQVSTTASGTVKSIEEKMFESKRLQKKIEAMTLERTKISKKKLKEIYEQKVDWYMTAEEAKKLGVIDEIIS